MQSTKWFIIAVLAASVARGQQSQPSQATTPDCQSFFTFTATGNGATFDNRTAGCNYWRVTYSNTGFSAISLVMQSADNSSGSAGTFGTFAGTVVTGSNPNTTTTEALTELSGYYPFTRMRLASATGSGTVQGTMAGWKQIPITGSVTASFTPSGTQDVNVKQVAGTNTVTGGIAGVLAVAGPQAAGVARTSNPLPTGMEDTTGKVRMLNSAADDYSLQVMIGGTQPAQSLADNQNNTQKWLAEANSGANYLGVVTYPYMYDGSTWDRVRGDSAGGMIVQGAGTAGSGAGGVVTVQGNASGTPIPISGSITATAVPGVTASTASTALTSYLTSAASTNSTSVKGSAGNVYAIRAVNTTATLYYLRMYNLASAPTCSSATGFVESIPIPASTTGAGIVLTQPFGQAYTTGIGYCITGGGSSTDNTNAATGVYLTILYF